MTEFTFTQNDLTIKVLLSFENNAIFVFRGFFFRLAKINLYKNTNIYNIQYKYYWITYGRYFYSKFI